MNIMKNIARGTLFNISPYVPGKPIEEVERELGISGVIKLASNENPLGPSPKAIAAMQANLDKVSNYPDSNCYYLKKELASYLGCGADNLIVGNGSDELLKLLAETFLNPGDEVICAEPSFSEYEFVARVMDARPVKVPLRSDFCHDLQAMAEHIGPRTKMVFICNPNNPTGTIISRQELAGFMDRVPDDVVVIIDEAYYEYVTDTSYPDSLELVKEGKKVVILRTFSKIFGLAGLRIGYGISTPEIISLVHVVREPFNVNLLAQEAARAALGDREHLQRSRELVLKGKERLYRLFEEMGLRYILTQANFVFVDTGRDSVQLFQKMLKEGVIIRSGDIFGYRSFIRVTVGTPEQNQRFAVAFRKVLENWDD